MPAITNDNFNKNIKEVTFDDGEFDVIESEPDSLSSEESAAEDHQPKKASPSKDALQKAKELKDKAASKAEERRKEIEATQIGLKEFLQVLDTRMLGYFVKSIFIYFVCAAVLCIFYIFFIYNFNQAMWHEYFPVRDQSDIEDLELADLIAKSEL